MIFCPKCGSILTPKKENDKKILVCSCGFKSEKGLQIKEEVEKKEDLVQVADEEKEDKVLPTTKETCPKCGNKEAYYWLIQTRAGDEPETKFLKCTKCKHIWRDYG